MLDTTEETVERLFSEAVISQGGSDVKDRQPIVERVKKIRDYAFVHFRDRLEALLAMDRMNGKYDVIVARAGLHSNLHIELQQAL